MVHGFQHAMELMTPEGIPAMAPWDPWVPDSLRDYAPSSLSSEVSADSPPRCCRGTGALRGDGAESWAGGLVVFPVHRGIQTTRIIKIIKHVSYGLPSGND